MIQPIILAQLMVDMYELVLTNLLIWICQELNNVIHNPV